MRCPCGRIQLPLPSECQVRASHNSCPLTHNEAKFSAERSTSFECHDSLLFSAIHILLCSASQTAYGCLPSADSRRPKVRCVWLKRDTFCHNYIPIGICSICSHCLRLCPLVVEKGATLPPPAPLVVISSITLPSRVRIWHFDCRDEAQQPPVNRPTLSTSLTLTSKPPRRCGQQWK